MSGKEVPNKHNFPIRLEYERPKPLSIDNQWSDIVDDIVGDELPYRDRLIDNLRRYYPPPPAVCEFIADLLEKKVKYPRGTQKSTEREGQTKEMAMRFEELSDELEVEEGKRGFKEPDRANALYERVAEEFMVSPRTVQTAVQEYRKSRN